MAQPRLLSHSEIDTALTCWARHAFAYTGRLTDGYALRPREIPLVLSEGRAHGAAVAKWHERGKTLMAALEAADALRRSLVEDEQEMRAVGLEPSVQDRVATEARLMDILGHYVTTVEPLGNLTRLEDEVIVPIPSRTGINASSRYRFQCFIDGWTVDEQGRAWLVEFKLRRRLHTVELIANSRQMRWYAWALRQAKGIEPVGVLVDETWNEVVAPPRMIASGVSHAKQQRTTAELYIAVCREHGVEPHVDTVDHFDSIRWHHRVPVLFRDGELDQAGRELVTAAQLIRDLDSGQLEPLRHVSPMTCGPCRFRRVCANPQDQLFVESLFTLEPPKRLRTTGPDLAEPDMAGRDKARRDEASTPTHHSQSNHSPNLPGKEVSIT